jgi:hypothetical protein
MSERYNEETMKLIDDKVEKILNSNIYAIISKASTYQVWGSAYTKVEVVITELVEVSLTELIERMPSK